MKLGNHTVGLRTTGKTGETDEYGDDVLAEVFVKVRWCLVTPTKRLSENDEPENRAAPTTQGMTLLAPPGTPVTASTTVVWPIQSETGDGPTLALTGPVWQVIGDPGPWDDTVEVQLRRSS